MKIRSKVFISYSRKDLPFAELIVAALTDRNFEVLLDKTGIAPGELWRERITSLIASADAVLFVISPDAISSSICAWELQETERFGKQLIPLLRRRIAGAEWAPRLDKAKWELGRQRWIQCTEESHFAGAWAEIDAALDSGSAWVREHSRLGELARSWEINGRRRKSRLRGADAEAAERWLDEQGPVSNKSIDLHREFIFASRKAETTQQRLRLWGSIVAAGVAFGFSAFALTEYQDAKAQRALVDQEPKRLERLLVLASEMSADFSYTFACTFRDSPGLKSREAIIAWVFRLQSSLTSVGGAAREELDPNVRLKEADGLLELGQSLLAVGAIEAARTASTRGQSLIEDLLGKHPDNNLYLGELSRSYRNMSDILISEGKITDAKTSLEFGREIDKRINLNAGGQTEPAGAR